MRTIIIALVALYSSAALADCYSITDPDQRAYCRAKTSKKPDICYSIQKSDLRAMCLAEVKRESTH